MRLRTIAHSLGSLCLGILLGILIGMGYLYFHHTETKGSQLFGVLGIFLAVLAMLLYVLAMEVEIHADIEEAKP